MLAQRRAFETGVPARLRTPLGIGDGSVDLKGRSGMGTNHSSQSAARRGEHWGQSTRRRHPVGEPPKEIDRERHPDHPRLRLRRLPGFQLHLWLPGEARAAVLRLRAAMPVRAVLRLPEVLNRSCRP